MDYDRHSNLKGTHATFSGSNWHWITKSDEEIFTYIENLRAKQIGTELHELAENIIKHKIKVANIKSTFYMYCRDAVGFRMEPEVCVYYSDNFYGFADSLLYDEKKRILRIFDLKTGKNVAHMEQLYVYAAFFCLEHNINPYDIQCELRIYQNNEVRIEEGDPDTILTFMEKTRHIQRLLESSEV